jgi:general secretion pathway protein N
MTYRPRSHLSAAPWGWAVAGALAGSLMAVLLFAPARWLASALEEASAGRVQLTNTRGTAWNGTAQLVLTGGAGSRDATTLPGTLQWQIRPQAGQLLVSVYASCCTPQPLRLQLRPRWGGITLAIADDQSNWPAQFLAGLGTPWNTVHPTGQLALSSQGLSLDLIEGRVAITGQVRLDAHDLSSRLSTLRPLGSYRLTLQGGTSPVLELATIKGSLQLTGSGRWIGSRLHFDGKAFAAPEREEALTNLLNIIGRRNGAQSIISLG